MMIGVTSVIMAYTSSDPVKQSISGLEKYHLFMENKLKQFICKEFNQCSSILRKIMLEGEMYHLLTQLPLTVDEKTISWCILEAFYKYGTELEWLALNAY